MTFHKGSGFHPHLPGFKHKFLAKALGATMWFFIFYRARFVLLLFLLRPFKLRPFFREDGPKLLVRYRFVARTKPIAYYTGFEAPVGGACTWASWRRSIASLIFAVPPSLHHCIGKCRNLCSDRTKECLLQTVKPDDISMTPFRPNWTSADMIKHDSSR